MTRADALLLLGLGLALLFSRAGTGRVRLYRQRARAMTPPPRPSPQRSALPAGPPDRRRARFAPEGTPADDLYPGDLLVREDGPHLCCCPDGSLCQLPGAVVVHADRSLSVDGCLCAGPERSAWTLTRGLWKCLDAPA